MADALSRVGRRAGTRSELEAMVRGASRVRDVYRVRVYSANYSDGSPRRRSWRSEDLSIL